MTTTDTLRAAVAEAREVVGELEHAVSRGLPGDEDLCDRAEAVFSSLDAAIEAHVQAEADARPKCDGARWAEAQRQAGKALIQMQWNKGVSNMQDAAERAGAACRMVDEMLAEAPERMGRRALRRMECAACAQMGEQK